MSILNGWNWLTIIKLFLGVVGIVGNLLVIVVYISKRKRQNTTNGLILALAITDLFTSANIIPWPTHIERVPQNAAGQLYCRIVFSNFFMWTSIVASVGILSTLSVERYLAVCRPLWYRTVFKRSRSQYIIVVIWVFAAVEKSFNLYTTIPTSEGTCKYDVPGNGGFQIFLAIGVFTAEYVVPLTIMIVTYIKTIQALKKQAANLLAHMDCRNNPAYSLLQTRRKVIEMLLVVIIAFLICWGPLQFAYLISNLGVENDYFLSTLQDAFTVLAFSNSCANPIIYTFKNKSFRNSLRERFCQRRHGNAVASLGTVSTVVDCEIKHETGPPHPRTGRAPRQPVGGLPEIG